MNIRSSLLPLLLSAVFASGTATAGFGDLLKSAEGLLDKAPASLGGTAGASLSDSQINAGLKEALSVGAERAVALLGKSGGFLNDKTVRIPLPGVLGTAAKGLRAAGQGKYVDQFETTVNRAAEQAIPKTLEIVKQTVRDMSLQDVRGILSGGDTAATEFLRERAGGSLREAIAPIVAEATDRAGATAAYKSLKSRADGALGGLGSLGGLVKTDSLDLDSYVTGKTLDGLFLKLAAEEKAIRENPVARSTELLKTVFGR
ncbi:MAG: DUF4197 domain-containing protein [Gammaproteobacteria bacterium]|nr:DUF4197 domain-containing protein [Gammaproteobacteria bacterium]